MSKSVGWLSKSRNGDGLVLQLYFNAERFYFFPDDSGKVMKIVDDNGVVVGRADVQTNSMSFSLDIENKRYVVFNMRKLLDPPDYLPVSEC